MQTVTECKSPRTELMNSIFISCLAAMNVIRMIKLFGWESKVKAQIEEKREEELHYYKKRQYLGLINMNIK